MFKWLPLLLLFWACPAAAQNTTCATRPVGDNSNACASTAFVHGNTFPIGPAGGDLGGTYPNPNVINGSHITNASVPNSGLVNDSTTVNGQTCTLGQTCTIPTTGQGCDTLENHGGGTGATGSVNDTAFHAAVSAFGTTGGCISFSPGIYQLGATLTVTYPTSTPYVVSFIGAGQDLSILNWAAAPTGTGLALATNKAGHAFHLSDLSFRVGVAAPTSVGFSVTNSTALGALLNSTINNVSFLGSDGGGATDYWGIGVQIVTQSAVNFTDDNFWGPTGDAATGIYVSSTSSPGYGVIYNVTGSNFYSLDAGFKYGDWIQGVTINACNFTTGNTGILVASGATGLLAELSVVNSQFGTNGDGIVEDSPVFGVNISNNYFLTNTGKVGIAGSSAWGGGTIIGNGFGVSGSVAGGQNGILIGVNSANAPTTIVGNTFLNNTTGVALGSPTNSITVGLNTYIGNTNKAINLGSTACPASASGNCVGTATSGAGFIP